MTDDRRRPIALAEKILALLDEGRFTATYKYAVLLALIDLSLENTSRAGEAPDTINTRELAEKVVEIYWPHCVPYYSDPEPIILRQNDSAPGRQAIIIQAIRRFRVRSAAEPSSSLARARSSHPGSFNGMMDEVEWRLIKLPLPRLQRFAHGYDRFLYSISWDKTVLKGEVTRYQRGESSDFDNRIQLMHEVGDNLVLLNGLLRPLIHRQWASRVAQINHLEESRLEEFLFGVTRIPLNAVRPGLQEIQDNRSFYCGDRVRSGNRLGPHVDHFIPWSRYPNNAIENLVIAHERCNNQKRDFLAAPKHVARWRSRVGSGEGEGAELSTLAQTLNWETDRERTLGVTRGIYLHLPPDVPLWVRRQEFVQFEQSDLAAILA